MSFLNDSEIKALQPRIKVLQFIIGALAMGVAFFLCIALVVTGGPKSWDLSEMLPLIGIVFSGITIVGWVVFPMVARNLPIGSSTVGGDANAETFMKLQTHSVIRGALVEGGAFLNLMLFIVEGNGFNLLAALVGLFLLLLLFPTASNVPSKIESLRR